MTNHAVIEGSAVAAVSRPQDVRRHYRLRSGERCYNIATP